jgi:hypothetical protein
MPADPRLRDLPALRKRAEELAREARDAHVSAIWSALYDSYGQALVDALPPMWAYEEAHLSLLSDLSRPASRDAVARLVAEALGMECGATAPEIRLLQFYSDGEPNHSWLLVVTAQPARSGYRWWSFHSEGEDPDGAEGWTLVPGISAVTDPTEAITLIALKVLGGPDAPT